MTGLIERAEMRDIVRYGRADSLPGRSWTPSQRRELQRRLEAGLPIASGGAQITADFEAGTNGSTILAADPGSATPWNSTVPVPLTDGTCAYDNTHVAHGTLAAKIAAATTDKTIYLAWTTALTGTSITSDAGRLYLYMTAAPVANFTVMLYRRSTGTMAAITITSARKIGTGDSTGTKATSTSVIPTGQYVRLDWQFVASATVGNMTVKYFATADGTTADETIGGGGNYNTGANVNEIRFGNTGGAALTSAFWLDCLGAGFASYPGPANPPQPLGPQMLGYYTQGQ